MKINVIRMIRYDKQRIDQMISAINITSVRILADKYKRSTNYIIYLRKACVDKKFKWKEIEIINKQIKKIFPALLLEDIRNGGFQLYLTRYADIPKLKKVQKLLWKRYELSGKIYIPANGFQYDLDWLWKHRLEIPF